jgi:hypothetical protein
MGTRAGHGVSGLGLSYSNPHGSKPHGGDNTCKSGNNIPQWVLGINIEMPLKKGGIVTMVIPVSTCLSFTHIISSE